MKKAFRVVGLITTFSFVGAYAISNKMNLIHPILPNMGGVSQPTFRSAQADCSSP